MHIIECWTLVDITHNGTKTPGDSSHRSQERNWETIIQILNLRTQITVLSSSAILKIHTNYLFGDYYVGEHLVWKFIFSHEFENLYKYGEDDFYYLRKDVENVPFIDELHETAKFQTLTFMPHGEYMNINFTRRI